MDLNLHSAFPVLMTKPFPLHSYCSGLSGQILQLTTLSVSFLCLFTVEMEWVSECPLFSSVPVPPGEIKRGRMGWAEISIGRALHSRLFRDPHTSGPCWDTWFVSSSVETDCAQSPLWDGNRWKEMKQLVWFYPLQVRFFCSHRAALIVIKPAVVYQKTCHKKDIITEAASTVI